MTRYHNFLLIVICIGKLTALPFLPISSATLHAQDAGAEAKPIEVTDPLGPIPEPQSAMEEPFVPKDPFDEPLELSGMDHLEDALLKPSIEAVQRLAVEGRAAEAIAEGDCILSEENWDTRVNYNDEYRAKLVVTLRLLARFCVHMQHPEQSNKLLGLNTDVIFAHRDLDRENLLRAEKHASKLLRILTTQYAQDDWKIRDARWFLVYVQKLAQAEPEQLKEIQSLEEVFRLKEVVGLHEDATKHLANLIPLGEELFGLEHPVVAHAHLDFADRLFKAGKVDESEIALSKALIILRKQLSDLHPSTQLSALWLLRLQILKNKHADAIEMLDLVLLASLTDELKEDLAANEQLVELTAFYKHVLLGLWKAGDDDNVSRAHKSLAALSEVLLIRERDRLGNEHWQVTDLSIESALLSLPSSIQRDYLLQAEACSEQIQNLTNVGSFGDAMTLCEKSIELRKLVLGEWHPVYAMSLETLADLYCSMDEYSKAEPLYVQTLEIRKKALGERHPDYLKSLSSLAELYWVTEDYIKAQPMFMQVLEISREMLEQTALDQSARQHMESAHRRLLDNYISFTLNVGQFQPSAARAVLRWKGWKGMILGRQIAADTKADDASISERFQQLQQVTGALNLLLREEFEAETSQETERWREHVKNLTKERKLLEALLVRDGAMSRDAIGNVTNDQIQAAIPEGSVLIDYLQFSRLLPSEKKGKWTSEESILATILPTQGDPVLVDLGPVEPIREAIDTWQKEFGRSLRGKAAANTLREKLWDPILDKAYESYELHLLEAFVATDGIMEQVPLGALPGRLGLGGTHLVDDRLSMIPAPQILPAIVNSLGRKELLRHLSLQGDGDIEGQSPKTPQETKNEQEH